MKNTKIFLAANIFLASIMVLSACTNASSTNPPSSEKPSENSADKTENYQESEEITIDNSKTGISMMTQEYIEDNIAEIPYITYDGEQPALAEYGGKNPEIDMINNALKNGIQQTYLDFMENREGDFIEIRTYPFSSDTYIQFVITCNTYPSYGTVGQLSSYNFDKASNHFIGLDEILENSNLNRETITKDVQKLFKPETPNLSISKVEIAGFLIENGTVNFLLDVTIDNTQAEPWSYFYSYIPETKTLTRLDARQLFAPSKMVQMEPPLSYQKQE